MRSRKKKRKKRLIENSELFHSLCRLEAVQRGTLLTTDALQKELVHDGKFCSRLVLHSPHFAYSFNMHAILMHVFLSEPLLRINLEYDQNKYRPSFTLHPLHTAPLRRRSS